MKQAVVLMLVLISLTFCLAGCSLQPSGVMIEDLEDSLGATLYEMRPFTIEDSENGSDLFFSSVNVDFTKSISITGYADKKQNVKSVTCLNMGVDTTLLSSSQEIVELLSRGSNDTLSISDISAGYCIMEAYTLFDLFGGTDADVEVDDFLGLFAEENEIVVNGWTITARLVPQSEIVQVMAVYN